MQLQKHWHSPLKLTILVSSVNIFILMKDLFTVCNLTGVNVVRNPQRILLQLSPALQSFLATFSSLSWFNSPFYFFGSLQPAFQQLTAAVFRGEALKIHYLLSSKLQTKLKSSWWVCWLYSAGIEWRVLPHVSLETHKLTTHKFQLVLLSSYSQNDH